MKRFTLTILLFLAALGTFAQTTVYIAPGGNDETGDGSLSNPFSSLHKAVSVAAQAKGPVTVMCRGGFYRIDSSVVISQMHDLTICAYEGERPVFRGSRVISGWKRVHVSSILSKVSPEARKCLVWTDLKAQGITDYGNAINEKNRPLLYCDGDEQMLARYPNEGFIISGRALGETLIPPVSNGNSGACEGIFEYNDPRVARWAGEKDPKIGGYFFWDWDDGYDDIVGIDTSRGSIRVSRDKMYRHGLRYFGLNLLCEIDAPGEWYLDRELGHLYWYPPVGIDPVKGGVETMISMFHGAPVFNIRESENIVLDGLQVCQSRSGAVSIKGGSHCSIQNCLIEDIGCNAVQIKDGDHHLVDGCVLRHLGGSGVYMWGGDRKNLVHCGHEMRNTLVEDWERFARTYRGAFSATGCGIHLHHCEMRNAPSSAFSLEGNDLVAEFNIISEVGKESDDQGGFDLYLNPSLRGIVMRYNYWRDIHGGTHYGVGGIRLDDLITGVQIYGNVFERCGSREFGAIQIHGGSENVIEDNLFYDCPQAVSLTPYGRSEWQTTYDSIQDKLFKEVNIHSPEYLLRYPEIREFGKNIDQNIIRNNLLVDCKARYFVATAPHGAEAMPQIEANMVEISSDSHPVEYFCTPELLHPLGIRAIPLEEMGIKHNKWINR